MPEVSVVVAVHDQARWIGETIASVRAQTFTDWELLVVDDGSTDGTADVVARFTDDPRVRYVRQERSERILARNRAIATSGGPLVAFLDGDDVWRPDKLERQLAALRGASRAALCYTTARFIDAEGRRLPLRKPPRPLSEHPFAELMRGNVIVLASVVVRRTALDAVGAFDDTLPVVACEDWDLWLRIARRFPVVGVDEELTLYRVHERNTARARVLEGALGVIDRWYADPETERAAGMSRSEARALHYWANAAWTDRRADALALAAHAFRESPPTVFSRSGLATLAALVLPAAAVRALRRVA